MKYLFYIAAFCSLTLATMHASLIDQMSVEEKVGQILMVHFKGEVANAEAEALIQKLYIGSIIYYNWANGLHSPEQVRLLSHGLQALAKKTHMGIPLFIAVDQEGGRVARLQEGFTLFPSNDCLGRTHQPELAEESAFAMGQEMTAVGVNMNLSPVVDVIQNPKSPIGNRSYSSNAHTVALFARNAVDGFQKAGIATSLKHFPGLGSVDIDTHRDLPILRKSIVELRNVDFVPFIVLGAVADTVMTAHVLVPSIDPENCVTLSKTALDLLRKETGFQGPIISDSLVMQGVLNDGGSLEKVAIKAFNAGCDILCFGGRQLVGKDAQEVTLPELKKVYDALVSAVRHGTISQSRLDSAVRRILQLKNNYLPSPKANKNLPNSVEHRALVKKIVAASIQDRTTAMTIADQIWKNECGGKIKGLTTWNKGENFASLGIGHFIWFPEDSQEIFQETFPDLLEFIVSEGNQPPEWLVNVNGCPWKTKDAFDAQQKSIRMESLRTWLYETRDLQAIFMMKRLEETIPIMLKGLSIEDQIHVEQVFCRLASDPKGLYALVDYLNFKGAGLSSKEMYNRQGWGLLQVILNMPSLWDSKKTLEDFAASAKHILELRIKNAPPERHEERWLKGWLNRINTYICS